MCLIFLFLIALQAMSKVINSYMPRAAKKLTAGHSLDTTATNCVNVCLLTCALRSTGSKSRVYPTSCPKSTGIGSRQKTAGCCYMLVFHMQCSVLYLDICQSFRQRHPLGDECPFWMCPFQQWMNSLKGITCLGFALYSFALQLATGTGVSPERKNKNKKQTMNCLK